VIQTVNDCAQAALDRVARTTTVRRGLQNIMDTRVSELMYRTPSGSKNGNANLFFVISRTSLIGVAVLIGSIGDIGDGHDDFVLAGVEDFDAAS
jgi:hypothetical protein